MRVWAKLMKISKVLIIIGTVFFLTSCSGVLPETDLVNQENYLDGSIAPESEYKAQASSIYLA